MATQRGMELEKLLNPLQKTVTSVTSSVARNAPMFASSAAQMNLKKMGDEMGAGMFSFAIALFIVFLVLIVVHYMITPIFSFTDGDGGMIPLADTKDGQLKWSKGPVAADLSANIVRIMDWGFTVQQDIYIENEAQYSNKKRIFSYRAMAPVVVTGAGDDLITNYPESNLTMYMDNNTNNLVVAATTIDNSNVKQIEVVMIPNVPVKQVLRLTVILLPQLMEVYLNGKLHATKTFSKPPLSSKAYFFGPPDAFRGTIRSMNFKYWDRPLTAVEVMKSTPPLPDVKLFSPSEMATAQCS